MSKNAHDQSHDTPIKTPKQLIVAIVLAFLVPILLITLLAQFVTNRRSVNLESGAMSPDAVAKRLKPVADLAFAEAGGGGPNFKEPQAAAAAQALPAAGKADGKKIYESTCVACHTAGVAGAPKAGDKTAWAPRLKAGMNALYASALNGKNAMPAKGGNTALTNAEVDAAVDYLTALAK